MKRTAASCFLILFLLAFGPFVHAQSTDWASLNNEARLLYQKSQYDQAGVLVNQALDVAQKEWGNEHPNVAHTLNNLGLIFQGQGEYAQAEPLYKRSLAIWKKTLGPDSPTVAKGMNNLGELYRVEDHGYNQKSV